MTEQELLQAIEEARSYSEDANGAMTSQEISEATGLGVKTVRKNLKGLIADGKVKPVWVTRDTIMTPLNGRTQRVPGYCMVTNG